MANKVKNIALSLSTMGLLVASTVFAQVDKPAASPSNTLLDELVSIDASISKLNKQTELKDALRKSAGIEALPQVVSIIIDREGPSARVAYSSGMVRTLRVGDFLQDGIKVLSIDAGTVYVGGKGGKSLLPFLAANQTQSGQAAGGMLPPIPR